MSHFNRKRSLPFAANRPNRRQVLQAGAALGVGAAQPWSHAPVLAQDAVSIDFWNWWDITRKPLMDEIIATFMEENPSITVNNVPQTWDRRDEVVVTALSGGDPPEVIMTTRQEIVNFAANGAIVPITKYVEAAQLDLDRYYPSEISSMWWNDELYALPMPTAGVETVLSFYNTDLFTQAGLDPETPPTTWAELDAIADQLTVMSDDGGIEILGVELGMSMQTFIAFLYTNNGTLYSDDLKTVTFNSAEGVQTLQWMLDFVNNHNGGHQAMLDFSAGFTEGTFPFLSQKIAYQFQNVSNFFHIQSNAPELNYNVGFRPYNGENPGAKLQGVAGLSFGWGYVIPQGLDPAVEEAAFKFVQRITYDESGACKFMLEQLRPSPLKDCNENPAYLEANPHWAKVRKAFDVDVPVGIVPPQTKILDTIEEYVELIAFEEMSVEEGLNEAASEAQGFLDEYWSSVS
jgi:multiple sugar transport system substrate-binding protein